MFNHSGRVFGDVQPRGNLGVAVPLRPQQYNIPGAVAVAVQQFAHAVQQGAGLSVGMQGVVGQVLRGHQFVGADGGVLPPQAFAPGVSGNREEPGLDAAFATERHRALQRPQECLAQQVFRRGGVAGQAAEIAVQVGAVEGVQFIQLGYIHMVRPPFCPYIIRVHKAAKYYKPHKNKNARRRGGKPHLRAKCLF